MTEAGGPTAETARGAVLEALADRVAGVAVPHTTRVAIDGITASGKTTLADELADRLEDRCRPVVRLSMDGYHHPRHHRYRQGRSSPDGYYEDAYDHAAFADHVLVPLGPGGDGTYRPAILDLAADEPVDGAPVAAPADAVLLVDGTFLQRPPLAGRWDLVVFVDTSFAVAAERGAARDADLLGGPEAARRTFADRYHAACRRYLAEVDARAGADVVVANDDPAHPRLVSA